MKNNRKPETVDQPKFSITPISVSPMTTSNNKETIEGFTAGARVVKAGATGKGLRTDLAVNRKIEIW